MAVDKEKMAESMAAQAAAVYKVRVVPRLKDCGLPVVYSIREALQASFPVAPEQLMTVQVPGTTINSGKSGGYWWSKNKHAETPHTVKVNEARLVDGMIPLSKIMVSFRHSTTAVTGWFVAGSFGLIQPDAAEGTKALSKKFGVSGGF